MPLISPRPTFKKAMSMLENSRCPECGRAFDPIAASEEYAPRIQPLQCRWCSQRLMLIRDFAVWQHQDAAAARAAKK